MRVRIKIYFYGYRVPVNICRQVTRCAACVLLGDGAGLPPLCGRENRGAEIRVGKCLRESKACPARSPRKQGDAGQTLKPQAWPDQDGRTRDQWRSFAGRKLPCAPDQRLHRDSPPIVAKQKFGPQVHVRSAETRHHARVAVGHLLRDRVRPEAATDQRQRAVDRVVTMVRLREETTGHVIRVHQAAHRCAA